MLTVRLPTILDIGVTRGMFRGFGVFAMAFAFATPIFLAVRWLRPLLRAGYGPRDIAAAIRGDADRKREERLFEHGTAPTTLEKRLSAITWVSAIACGGSWAALAFGATADWLWPVIFATSAIYPITGLAGATTSRRRQSGVSWWAKRWDGRLGRWLAKLASINLGRRTAAADRPTEMAIAFSAQALLDELPTAVRASLGGVSEMVRELEQRALAMRDQIKALDESIADVRSGPGAAGGRNSERHESLVADLHDARAKSADQLADLVAALESTRLDLLRLRAGQTSAESITAHLEATRRFADDVDRLMSSQAEVDAALRMPTEPTPV
jgi:hypothetical protein